LRARNPPSRPIHRIVGVVEETVGGVGGKVAGGGRDAVAGMVEGGLDDARGAPVEAIVSQVERVETVQVIHPDDLQLQAAEAAYCTKFRRMISAPRGNQEDKEAGL
jgi:hypothetical protein